MLGRIVIEDLRPSTPTRAYPAKGVAGEPVRVSAAILKEGHDILAAAVRWRPAGTSKWSTAAMSLVGNDKWVGEIVPAKLGLVEFVVDAWTDHYATWRHHALAKAADGQAIDVELEELALMLDAHAETAGAKDSPVMKAAAVQLRDTAAEASRRLEAGLAPKLEKLLTKNPYRTDLTSSDVALLWADRPIAARGAWYEMFPRSEGGLRKAANRLEAIAKMGFEVLYLPPIHPIGETARKGKNNTLDAEPGDPGSPWAIGSKLGGHTALEPGLGSFDDFDFFVKTAESLGIEIALDYALQCSPDHPWVKEHPEWFHHRPDGSIKYAENPPKKYQDIYPINFWPEKGREELWNACKDILEFWIEKGVKIFRVDNPHTKPFAFWEWLIPAIQAKDPEVIFLSEAFTRPKVMAKLAEIGFSQSYTYFTWRTAKWELTEYLTEIALGPKADYMRPNFWTNTQDILSGPLRNGGPGAFKHRLVLAATMSPNYGMYNGYELMENLPASDKNEEYLNSEKYEIKARDWDTPYSLERYIDRVNSIRKAHPAFREIGNIHFHHSNNEHIIAYSKTSPARDPESETAPTFLDVMLMVVNLDEQPQETTLWLDMEAIGMPIDQPYEAHDEITGAVYLWEGAAAYIRLDPDVEPAHVFHLRRIS